MLDTLKKILFSTKLTAVLFLLFALAMGLGTFIESWYSTETARIYIYDAKWFEVIMVFFVINFIGNIGRYRLWQWNKWPLLAPAPFLDFNNSWRRRNPLYQFLRG